MENVLICDKEKEMFNKDLDGDRNYLSGHNKRPFSQEKRES